jgi:hypothetical protein
LEIDMKRRIEQTWSQVLAAALRPGGRFQPPEAPLKPTFSPGIKTRLYLSDH